MSPAERTEWLEARLTGIGGSEASAVFNLGWGCSRKLAYTKRRIEPDYPRETSLIMALGNLMEPFFADQYVEKTGRTVSSPAAFTHPDHPELRVNIDRLIQEVDGKTGRGVLEIKSQGRATYSKTRREGMSEDYILQLQWGMLVTGCQWGSFAVGCRDSGEMTYWDVDRDEDICNSFLTAGPKLWADIKGDGPLPDRLEVDDKRCGSCEWRQTCQGNALVHDDGTDKNDLPYAEDIRPLLMQYDEVMEKFTEKLPDGSKGTVDDLRLAEVKEELRTALGSRAAVAVSWPSRDRKIYFRAQDGRITWKSDDLVKVYEDMRRHLRLRMLLEKPGLPEEDVDAEFERLYPPAEKFKRQSVPFKTLRVY